MKQLPGGKPSLYDRNRAVPKRNRGNFPQGSVAPAEALHTHYTHVTNDIINIHKDFYTKKGFHSITSNRGETEST